jgi:serine/threonine protein phosphatase PrpC
VFGSFSGLLKRKSRKEREPGEMASPFLPTKVVSIPYEGADEDGPVVASPVGAAQAIVLGTFDGLGGSGAQRISTPEGVLTSAAWASRLAARITESTIRSVETEDATGVEEWGDFQQALQSNLITGLSEAASLCTPISNTILRGSLSRKLPTTVSVVAVLERPGGCDVHAVWAGDSRSYVWNPQGGLMQLSRDHTRRPVDAFTAIHEDAPMNNFASGDRKFHLERHSVHLKPPFLFLSCTDGAYNYFRSPMEFELAVLQSVQSGIKQGDIEAALREAIQSVTQDDATLALSGVGWRTWQELRVPIARREGAIRRLLEKWIGPAASLAHVTSDHRALPETQVNGRANAWARYRSSYERLLSPTALSIPNEE